MIQTRNKGVNQKPAVSKGVAPAMPSRAFALWLTLLFLYFLLLPSAAETPRHDAAFSSSTDRKIHQTLSVAPGYRLEAPGRPR